MIHIFYRHYNVEGNNGQGRPIWFDYRKCFINLIDSIYIPSPSYTEVGKFDERIKITVVYDGDSLNDNWIGKIFSDYNYPFMDFVKIQAGSDWESFKQTCEIIKNNKNITKDDFVYFLENDYLHVYGWIDKVLDLFKEFNVDYVSLYDHGDKYFLSQYQNLLSKIISTKSSHWRTTPSTCGSFIINKELFDVDYSILYTFKGDHAKFLWLHKNRKRFVLTPIPSLSTHCVEPFLAPSIDWQNYSK